MNDVISSYRYDLVWANGLNFAEENSKDEANNSHACVYSADEVETIKSNTPSEKTTKDINGKLIGWLSKANTSQ